MVIQTEALDASDTESEDATPMERQDICDICDTCEETCDYGNTCGCTMLPQRTPMSSISSLPQLQKCPVINFQFGLINVTDPTVVKLCTSAKIAPGIN